MGKCPEGKGGLEGPVLLPFGRLEWIDVVLLVWFAATLASVIYVAYDAIRINPEMRVMRWGGPS